MILYRLIKVTHKSCLKNEFFSLTSHTVKETKKVVSLAKKFIYTILMIFLRLLNS